VIAEYAKKKKADLIVVPSLGQTGLKRLLIGSVAERVVRLAHCPMLVLPN
jgi:nucleotide-binding universal stress UspA family protein